MLVLTRKVGEKILIGDNISITVVRVAKGAVRIGIDAPDDIPIVREEIKDEGQRHSRDHGDGNSTPNTSASFYTLQSALSYVNRIAFPSLYQ